MAGEPTILRMRRDLGASEPDPDWPAGIRVRTFKPDDGRPVHALLDAAYAAWDGAYIPVTHDEWLERMVGDEEFDASVWWLTESNDELVGCALHWGSGWVKDLAVRESHRGRGLGEALLRQGFAEFARRGVTHVGLKVDAANPTGAVQLYERVGFVVEP